MPAECWKFLSNHCEHVSKISCTALYMYNAKSKKVPKSTWCSQGQGAMVICRAADSPANVRARCKHLERRKKSIGASNHRKDTFDLVHSLPRLLGPSRAPVSPHDRALLPLVAHRSESVRSWFGFLISLNKSVVAQGHPASQRGPPAFQRRSARQPPPLGATRPFHSPHLGHPRARGTSSGARGGCRGRIEERPREHLGEDSQKSSGRVGPRHS
jgi:hypothetical protein